MCLCERDARKIFGLCRQFSVNRLFLLETSDLSFGESCEILNYVTTIRLSKSAAVPNMTLLCILFIGHICNYLLVNKIVMLKSTVYSSWAIYFASERISIVSHLKLSVLKSLPSSIAKRRLEYGYFSASMANSFRC